MTLLIGIHHFKIQKNMRNTKKPFTSALFPGVLFLSVLFLGVFLVWLLLRFPVSSQTNTAVDTTEANTIRITSFNIHYTSPRQKKLAWGNRREAVKEAIADLNADIIAFQEMETFAGGSYNQKNEQLDWVLEHFPEYRAGAYGDAAIYPNTQPIIYKHERFSQKSQGFFFFSDTPDVIYSRTFNGSWPAFCSWTELVDNKTGQTFFIYNVHFEYKSMSNRSKSAKLVRQRIKPVLEEGNAVLLVGDINAPGFAPTVRKLTKTPLTLAKPVGATFHFNRGLNLIPAIDHVFYSEHFTQQGKTTLLRKSYDDVWPTDHYPVTVELSQALQSEQPAE